MYRAVIDFEINEVILSSDVAHDLGDMRDFTFLINRIEGVLAIHWVKSNHLLDIFEYILREKERALFVWMDAVRKELLFAVKNGVHIKALETEPLRKALDRRSDLVFDHVVLYVV